MVCPGEMYGHKFQVYCDADEPFFKGLFRVPVGGLFMTAASQLELSSHRQQARSTEQGILICSVL